MEILEKGIDIFKNIPRKYYLPLGVGCVGLMLFVYGIWVVVGKTQPRENSDFYNFSQTQVASNSAELPQATILVDVEGAVANPGVYHIVENARVQDALVAAGGLSGAGDRAWVAQHVNLAAKISDGTKIYIPTVGEIVSGQSAAAQVGPVSTNGVLGATTNQQIDINSASATDLDSLPGVGLATANKIISGRPYASVGDLLTKKVVSSKVFGQIKDMVIAQ